MLSLNNLASAVVVGCIAYEKIGLLAGVLLIALVNIDEIAEKFRRGND